MRRLASDSCVLVPMSACTQASDLLGGGVRLGRLVSSAVRRVTRATLHNRSYTWAARTARLLACAAAEHRECVA